MIWTQEAIPEIYELQCQTLAESAGIHFQNKLVSTGAGSELGDSLALPSLQNTAFQGISGRKEIQQNQNLFLYKQWVKHLASTLL